MTSKGKKAFPFSLRNIDFGVFVQGVQCKFISNCYIVTNTHSTKQGKTIQLPTFRLRQYQQLLLSEENLQKQPTFCLGFQFSVLYLYKYMLRYKKCSKDLITKVVLRSINGSKSGVRGLEGPNWVYRGLRGFKGI